MAEAARKINEPTAHRITMSEVLKRGDWLVERIRRRYTHLTPQGALGWIRTVADDSRNFFFVANDGGVALCEQLRENLDPMPVVFERFVLAWSAEYIPQAAVLYKDIRRWAEGIQAREIHVENFTDIPRPMIKLYLGKQLYERVILFANIEKP